MTCEKLNIQAQCFQKLNQTRWAARYDSLHMMKSSYPAIIGAVEEITKSDRTRTTSHEAPSLLMHIKQFKFVVMLHM